MAPASRRTDGEQAGEPLQEEPLHPRQDHRPRRGPGADSILVCWPLVGYQVRQYYAKFVKKGNPRKARIDKADFCQIMQVTALQKETLDIGPFCLFQTCYPRTYKSELAEDIFRIYDMDNNGSVDFQVDNI